MVINKKIKDQLLQYNKHGLITKRAVFSYDALLFDF
jgi:hypothetical protein